jgi:hypothetical protein
MEHITTAIAALDPKKDSDWTENGRPSLARIRVIAKNKEITQAELDAAAPEAKRPLPPAGPTAEEIAKAPLQRVVNERRVARPSRELPEPVSNVRMIAVRPGYYGAVLREAGESFVFTGVPGDWMRPETAEEAKARTAAEAKMASGETIRPNAWAHEVSKAP